MNAGKLAAMAMTGSRRYHDGMNPSNVDAAPGVTWFVSRHPGAIEWAKRQGLVVDRWVAHLDPAVLAVGDAVIGTLPVNLAAEICKRGVRYLHLSLNVTPEWRGRELSADDLQALAAHIEPYRVAHMHPDFSPEPE